MTAEELALFLMPTKKVRNSSAESPDNEQMNSPVGS